MKSNNVALDKGAQYTYKVTATVTDANGTVSIHEAEYQVPYYDSLQNGSFEIPKTSAAYTAKSNSDYKNDGGVWQTTGLGTGDNEGKDIEILNVNYASNTTGMWPYYSWYGDAVAADGNQFVELNAEAYGSLYQDVLTVPGSSLNWWLSHRARGSKQDATPEHDTMYLLIMSTNQAEEANITDQSQVMDVINNIEDYPGAEYWEFRSDDQAWHYYSSDGISTDVNGKTLEQYEVPEDQYLTRFFFVAGDTESGGPTMGNFLDQVGFGYDLPPAQDGQGNLKITKKVLGISAEDIKNYSVSFDVYKVGADENEKLSFSPLTINSFTEMTGVDGDGREYTYFEGSVFRAVDAADKNSGTQYLVKEISGAEVNGYVLDETGSNKGDKNVTVLEKGTGEAEFTNAYIQSKCEITVKKEVAGNMGEKEDTEKKYSFTYETGDGESGNFELTAGGTTTISVTAGTSLKITEAEPQGYEVSWKLNGKVVEITGDGDTGAGDAGAGETGTGDVGTGDTGAGDTGTGDAGTGETGAADTGTVYTGTSYTAKNVQEGMEITCVNTRNVKTPTGIFTNNRPFILMFGAALIGLAGFMLSGRRKRRYQR